MRCSLSISHMATPNPVRPSNENKTWEDDKRASFLPETHCFQDSAAECRSRQILPISLFFSHEQNYCEFCFRIALTSDSVRPLSQLWHPSFSPLYDVFNLTTHVFSESLWHVLFTDAPVMTMKKTHANTKTKTKTMTKTKWLKDLACAIFFKMIWLKDIKSDDESVMHH